MLTWFYTNDKMEKSLYGAGRCHGGGRRSALPVREVMRMVTWNEVFTYSLVLIGFAGLIVQICKKK